MYPCFKLNFFRNRPSSLEVVVEIKFAPFLTGHSELIFKLSEINQRNVCIETFVVLHNRSMSDAVAEIMRHFDLQLLINPFMHEILFCREIS